MVECFTCGKQFNKHRSAVEKNQGDKHFCTPDCWYSFNQRDNHYLWAGGQTERTSPDAHAWRKAVMRRDKGHCRLCHATDRLEAHHIKPFRSHPNERWKVENGLTLCFTCHRTLTNCEMDYADILAAITKVELVLWYVDNEEAGDPATPA